MGHPSVGQANAGGYVLHADELPHPGLLETYDAAIAELEEMDDPAVETLLASLRALRERAERQLADVSAHLLVLS